MAEIQGRKQRANRQSDRPDNKIKEANHRADTRGASLNLTPRQAHKRTNSVTPMGKERKHATSFAPTLLTLSLSPRSAKSNSSQHSCLVAWNPAFRKIGVTTCAPRRNCNKAHRNKNRLRAGLMPQKRDQNNGLDKSLAIPRFTDKLVGN